MTENDYIAEFVKEKHPYILGVDYGLWKMVKILTEGIKQAVEIINGHSYEEIKDCLEDYKKNNEAAGVEREEDGM